MILADSANGNSYEFCGFRLDADRRVLLDADNSVVDVTPKALAILCILVKAKGNVVSKAELMRQAWPESYVEEANLSHHIFRLRKALGEGDEKFIETVSKRGYRFVAPLKARAETFDPHLSTAPSSSQPTAISTIARGLIALGFVTVLAVATYLLIGRSEIDAEKPPAKTAVTGNASMSISPVTTSGDRGCSTISPNGKFMAYAQTYASGEGVLYIRQTDTNAEIKLIEGGKRHIGVTAFSPDGLFLYYVVIGPGEVQALYRIPVLGGQPTRMAVDLNYFFTLSGDGTQAAFYRTDKTLNQTSIIMAALDGSGQERVLATFNDQEKSTDSVPALSPDGKTIIFGLADEAEAVDKAPARVALYSLSVADGNIKVLSSEKWMGIGIMNWMPDGSGAVFVGYRAGTLNQLHFVSYPGGEWRQITNELGGYGNYGMGITADGKTMVADRIEFSSQIWSSDSSGKARGAYQLTTNDQDGGQGLVALANGDIVYTSRSGAEHDIWDLRKSGNGLEAFPLTDDPYNEVEPVVSRDGRFLVFISDRSGTRHIYVSDVDGSNPRQLTFGDSVDRNPDITPDGESVIYASLVNNENRIWKVPLKGGPSAPVTDFESVAPSISPDGRSIVCIRPVKNAAERGSLEVVSLGSGRLEATFGGVPSDWYYVPPKWTPDGRSIIYRRTDTPVGNLWKQDLEGGEPQQFTDFPNLKMYNFAFSRDGKRLITARGTIKVTVLRLKNFI